MAEMTPNSLPKSKIVVWSDLSRQQSTDLLEAPAVDDVKKILAEIFSINEGEGTEDVLLNLYITTVQYARDQHFTAAQLSACFSIVKNLHEFCIESPLMNVDETFAYLKQLILRHSVSRPPASTELFSFTEVKSLVPHLINTYFRHFKLYKYVFTPKVKLDLTIHTAGDAKASRVPELSSVSEETKREGSGRSKSRTRTSSMDNAAAAAAATGGGGGGGGGGTNLSDKEKAKRYITKLITDLIQEKVCEIKDTVNESLESSEKNLNNKLEDAGYQSKKHSKKKQEKLVKLKTSPK